MTQDEGIEQFKKAFRQIQYQFETSKQFYKLKEDLKIIVEIMRMKFFN